MAPKTIDYCQSFCFSGITRVLHTTVKKNIHFDFKKQKIILDLTWKPHPHFFWSAFIVLENAVQAPGLGKKTSAVESRGALSK